MNSKNGRNSTRRVSLSKDDVCAIIKIASDCGVSELSFNGLRISFGKPATLGDQTPVVATPADVNTEQLEAEAIQDDAALVKKDRLEHMLIEDPVTYEQLLLAGELENDGHSEAE